MKICKREGCQVKVQARGLCNNHYTQWHRTLTFPLAKSDTRERLLEAMPGTTKSLTEAVGLTYEAVRKAVRKLHADGLCHIEDHLPPQNCGRPYMPVFSRGPGVDHKVTKKQRQEDHLAARRAWYHRNESKPRAAHQRSQLDQLMHRMVA